MGARLGPRQGESASPGILCKEIDLKQSRLCTHSQCSVKILNIAQMAIALLLLNVWLFVLFIDLNDQVKLCYASHFINVLPI